MKYYFDNEEGLSRSTSHPKFNDLLKDEIYTDIVDEFTPFGNDEGWETLRALEDAFQNEESGPKNFIFILDFLSERLWRWGSEWDESDLSLTRETDIEKIKVINSKKPYLLNAAFQMLLATSFGQMKIEGKIDPTLKEMAQKAIHQQIIITSDQLENNEIDIKKLIKVVDGESTRINNEGNINPVLKTYIKRLNKMNSDLEKLPLKPEY